MFGGILSRRKAKKKAVPPVIGSSPVKAGISGTMQVGKTTMYTVHVENTVTSYWWQVDRRFSEFTQLRSRICSEINNSEFPLCPGCKSLLLHLERLDLPGKYSFSINSHEAEIQKQKALSELLMWLCYRMYNPEIKRCRTCGLRIATHLEEFLSDGTSQRIHVEVEGELVTAAAIPEEFHKLATATSMMMSEVLQATPANASPATAIASEILPSTKTPTFTSQATYI